MIQKKSTRMIMFAVIAVIIVAVPITLYEGSFFNSPPPVTVNSRLADASEIWKCNFTRCPEIYYVNPWLRTTSSISENGHPNSILSFSLWAASCNEPAQGPAVGYRIYLLVSGNFTSNLHPNSIYISTYSTMPSAALNLSDWFWRNTNPNPIYSNDAENSGFYIGNSTYNFIQNDTFGNVSLVNFNEQGQCESAVLNMTSVYKLTNNTELGKNATYRFSFYTTDSFTICNTIISSPFYVDQTYSIHFTVTLNGLSKPVTNQIILNLEDVTS